MEYKIFPGDKRWDPVHYFATHQIPEKYVNKVAIIEEVGTMWVMPLTEKRSEDLTFVAIRKEPSGTIWRKIN